jgi:hypothetical protein
MRASRESNGYVYLIPDAGLEFPVRIIERKHSESWVAEMTAELDQAFDMLDHPPVRITWLRGKDSGEAVSEIIVVCPHALSDGLAAAYLLRDLLLYLGAPATHVETMPLTSPMSELIPDFPGKRMKIWRARLKAASLKFMLSHAPKPGEQPHEEVDSARPKYFLRAWELTPEQTAALAARSRSEGTSVHAALCTAFLRAFGDAYGDAYGETHAGGWNRKIQSPVNLRERLTRPVGETFGLFVNLVEFSVDCAPERNFWEIAREIKQGFIWRTGDKHIFNSLVEANVIMDELSGIITPKFVAQSFMSVDYDLSITNLGRLDFPVQYGALQLEALYGPSLCGSPQDIVLGVITIRDKMHFTLSFTDSKMNLSQAERIIEKAMDWLAMAIEMNRLGAIDRLTATPLRPLEQGAAA